MKLLLCSIALLAMATLCAGDARAATLLYELFESPIDTLVWDQSGNSSLSLGYDNSGLGLWPNDDGCGFSMWTKAKLAWGQGCRLGVWFATNTASSVRNSAENYIMFGLTDGVADPNSPCRPGANALPDISLKISVSTADQSMTLLDSSGDEIWKINYPPSADRIWHNAQFEFVEKSPSGGLVMEILYDSYYWLVEMPGVYPDSLHVCVGGRSPTKTNVVDNILFDEAYRRLQWEAVAINGQQLSSTFPAMTVAPNSALAGTFGISYRHRMPESHVMPLAVTPNWGDRSLVYWQAAGDMFNDSVVSGSYSLTAPPTRGIYHVIFATHGQYNAAQIASGTSWHLGNPIWGNGDDIYDWNRSAIRSAMTNGYVTALMTDNVGTNYELYGAQAIEFKVGFDQDVVFQPTVVGETATAILRFENLHAPPISIVSFDDPGTALGFTASFAESLAAGFSLEADGVVAFPMTFSPLDDGAHSIRIALLNQATLDTLGVITGAGEGKSIDLDVEVSGYDHVNDAFAPNDTMIVGITSEYFTQVDSVLCHYRAGGETAWRVARADARDLAWRIVIPLLFAQGRGLDYFLSAHNGEAVVRWHSPESPARLKSYVREFPEPLRSKALQYDLHSIPIAALEPTIAGVFADDLGGSYLSDWRLILYDPGAGDYIEYSDPRRIPLARGSAFWLVTRNDVTLDLEPSSGFATSHGEPFGIRLLPGWNLVGSPFAFAVAWDSTTVDGSAFADAFATGLVSSPVRWDRDHYVYSDIRDFEPWRGYWVKNMTDPPREIRLEVPPREASAASGKDSGRAKAGTRISIRASCDGYADGDNFLGLSPDAADTWDPADAPEPPLNPEHGISVYFPHGGWTQRPGGYTCDIRSGDLLRDAAPDQVWRFDVAKNFAQRGTADEVILEFDGIRDVPDGAGVFLLDRRLGRLVDLRREGSYRFLMGEKGFMGNEMEARFNIFLGTEADMLRQIDALNALPRRTALFQNLPNPFNPSTVIGYEIAGAGQASLKIYDLQGRLVATLHNGPTEAGRHEAAWHGMDDDGRAAPAGVYIVRLEVDDGTVEARKLTLMK